MLSSFIKLLLNPQFTRQLYLKYIFRWKNCATLEADKFTLIVTSPIIEELHAYYFRIFAKNEVGVSDASRSALVLVSDPLGKYKTRNWNTG